MARKMKGGLREGYIENASREAARKKADCYICIYGRIIKRMTGGRYNLKDVNSVRDACISVLNCFKRAIQIIQFMKRRPTDEGPLRGDVLCLDNGSGDFRKRICQSQR